jgi:hypothetical protein
MERLLFWKGIMDQLDEDDDDARFAEKVAAIEAESSSAADVAPVVRSGNRGTRSFTLYQPIKVDGKLLTRVSIRPPVGGDLDDWASGEVVSSRAMLARLSGLHPAVLRGLDSVDLEILYQMFWDMVPDWMRDVASNSQVSA